MRQLALLAQSEGFRLGLVVTTFGFGLRHGIDWDHIAAITDITSSQDSTRTSMFFATLYALGHASVVFVLGVFAITLGDRLPDSVDAIMGRVVGITLIVLGVYVFYSLIRHGRDFRMRSRWMLIFAGARRGAMWIRRRGAVDPSQGDDPTVPPVEHEHEHVSGTPHHAEVETTGETMRKLMEPHRHAHRHPAAGPVDPFMNYGKRTSFTVGMIHGIGAETPTQVLIFLAAAGAGGPVVGVALLLVFLLGLVVSNTAIAVASTYGFLASGRSFAVYATVAVFTGAFSLILGVLFLLDYGTVLPAIFGG